MATIYLLRHGQTPWNKDRIFRGLADVPLDEHGLAQADCAAQALADTPLAEVHTSPLSRAVQTAKPTAATKNLTVIEASELLDIDYGQWSGKSQDKVEELFPDLSRLWQEAPQQIQFPDGEDLEAVRKRAYPYLLSLGKSESELPILVVSHRVVLKVLICAALDMPLAKFWQVQLDTASLSILNFEDNKFTLCQLNDTCHLKSLGSTTDLVDF